MYIFVGNTYTISVSVKEIPQNLSSFTKLTEIYLKKPDGRVLKSLPVSDSSNAIRRSVSAEVTLSEVMVKCPLCFIAS